jgi:quinol monooxygenase YgiN
MEIFIFARAHARPGRESDVECAIRDVLLETRNETGCISVHGYRSVKDPQLFYVHSHWRNEAAFDLHAELPHTVRFVETLEPLLDHEFVAERTAEFV